MINPYRKADDKHIVASRPVNARWSKHSYAELSKARMRYNAGTHEMCQGREGNALFQYCIPRKNPAGRRDYFDPPIFSDALQSTGAGRLIKAGSR